QALFDGFPQAPCRSTPQMTFVVLTFSPRLFLWAGAVHIDCVLCAPYPFCQRKDFIDSQQRGLDTRYKRRVRADVDANAVSAQCHSFDECRAPSNKRVENQVAGLGKELYRSTDKARRESCRVTIECMGQPGYRGRVACG